MGGVACGLRIWSATMRPGCEPCLLLWGAFEWGK